MRKFGVGVPKLSTAETFRVPDGLEDSPQALMWWQMLYSISYIVLKSLEANGYDKVGNT